MTKFVIALLALLVSGQVSAWHWENSVREDLGADKGLFRFVQVFVADKGDDLPSAGRMFLKTPQGMELAKQQGKGAQGRAEATVLALNSRDDLLGKLRRPNRFPAVQWSGKQATIPSPEAINITPGLSYVLLVGGPEGMRRPATKAAPAVTGPKRKATAPPPKKVAPRKNQGALNLSDTL